MKTYSIIIVLFSLFVLSKLSAQQLDPFEDISGWKAIASDGVKLNLEQSAGISGKALCLNFEFQGGAGYGIAQKKIKLHLSSNYKFSFYLKAETPINNFEFKLLDTADNVWWIKKLNIEYPTKWTKLSIKKRQISFAWGPAGGGEIREIDRIEFVVSAGTGGKGKIFIDDFRLDSLKETPGNQLPTVTTSSSAKKNIPAFVVDMNTETSWESRGMKTEWLLFDLQEEKEFGGVVIDWDSTRFARRYAVELSSDKKRWDTVYTVSRGNGKRDYIPLPEAETRYIRLSFLSSNKNKGYKIKEVQIKNVDFSVTPNDLFYNVASESPRGYYPRYFYKEQAYWTVLGLNGDRKEAMINQDGLIEVGKLSFSLEPFLYIDGKLITWNDVISEQSLEDGYLPIPSVVWNYKGIKLHIRPFVSGIVGRSKLIVEYSITNEKNIPVEGKLHIAIRPFQVNPPAQFLNIVGGVAKINDASCTTTNMFINKHQFVKWWNGYFRASFSTFDEGNIVDYLAKDTFPNDNVSILGKKYEHKNIKVHDPIGYLSGVISFPWKVEPRKKESRFLGVAMFDSISSIGWNGDEINGVKKYWKSRLDNIGIHLPKSAEKIVNTIKSNLAYILINRDSVGIQPGSRSYERSWIRDGALTSTALLQMGMNEEVRQFIDWYAVHQYPSGKIPCVVDLRGADPVPENDSHGEFIYAVLQYFHFTKDTAWLKGKFDHVVKVVRYMQELRGQQMTEQFKNGTAEQRSFYGLLTESISHEGYSAKPMHSYWDDFFALRGFRDAAIIAGILQDKKYENEFSSVRDSFQHDLYASINLAMANHSIDYIPGCAELGDFDATSTAIAINPIDELGNIPEPQIHNTFDGYFKFFEDRRDGKIQWENYTPYEVRIIGAYIYLDQKERAHELLTYFMKDQRPQGWNHWAEVVWRDPKTPKYIGDMPHTWVASDFIRSVRSMFVYEHERDSSLVLGAGIIADWLGDPEGMLVENLPTYYGKISYSMKKIDKKVEIEISGDVQIPSGKIIIKSPLNTTPVMIEINGKPYQSMKPNEVVVSSLPAKIVLVY